MSTLKRLESIRASIASKRAELHALTSMPLTPSECESRVDELLDCWRGELDTQWLGRQLADCRPLDPTDDILSTAMAGSKVKLASLLATFMPETLRSTMIEASMPHANSSSPTEAERIAKQQRLEAEVHGLEVQEERTIVALESAGVEVFRRPDADPSIILSTIA